MAGNSDKKMPAGVSQPGVSLMSTWAPTDIPKSARPASLHRFKCTSPVVYSAGAGQLWISEQETSSPPHHPHDLGKNLAGKCAAPPSGHLLTKGPLSFSRSTSRSQTKVKKLSHILAADKAFCCQGEMIWRQNFTLEGEQRPLMPRILRWAFSILDGTGCTMADF